MVRLIVLMLFCLFNLFGFGQTQNELNEIAYKDYQKVEKRLNSVYQKILQEYKSDTAFIKNLKIAQKIWIQFRHAEMRVKFPDTYLYGSSFPMCWSSYLAELTDERTKKLRGWLKGTEEGDVCAGSVKRIE